MVRTDSGSTDRSFISEKLVDSFNLKKYPDSGAVGMASLSYTSKLLGYCLVYIKLEYITM